MELPSSLTFELVTPDRAIVREAVDEVQIPGMQGSLGVLPGRVTGYGCFVAWMLSLATTPALIGWEPLAGILVLATLFYLSIAAMTR